MTHLILERAFDPPRSLADVHEGIRGSGWCFDLYQVAWQGSFLSADGRTMVCSFVAPDVESARVALRKTGADTRRLWAASVHDAPSPGNPNVIVERSFPAPDTFERLKAIVDTKAWCLEQHRVIGPARSCRATAGGCCVYTRRRTPNPCASRSAKPSCPSIRSGDSNGSVWTRFPVRPDAPGQRPAAKRAGTWKFHERSHAESHDRGRSLRPRPVRDRFHST